MKIFITDIVEAVERSDTAALEKAFDILVGWPGAGTIEGTSPKARKAALGRVCEALATHDAPMPKEIVAIVRSAGEGLGDGSYSAGAYHVKRHRGHFHAMLEQTGR